MLKDFSKHLRNRHYRGLGLFVLGVLSCLYPCPTDVATRGVDSVMRGLVPSQTYSSSSNFWKREPPKADTWLRFYQKKETRISNQRIAPATEKFEMPTWETKFYLGRKYTALVSNQSLGIVIGVPMKRRWRLEFEGEWRDGGINYEGTRFDFAQASSGGTLQYVPWSGSIQPYVGAGVVGLYAGHVLPLSLQPRWLGVAQVVAGSNIYLSEEVSVGLQGTVLSGPLEDTHGSLAHRPAGNVRVLGTIGVRL